MTDDASPDLDGIDVVHAFGVPAELLREARMRHIPVCVSTIYIEQAYRYGVSLPLSGKRLAGRARTAGSLTVHAFLGEHLSVARKVVQREIDMCMLFESADMLLPNSESEARAVRKELGVSTPYRVVPNGVDPHTFFAPERATKRKSVVCAGRFEPHKNQLRLIKALRGAPFDVKVVGPMHPDHASYARKCEKAAGGNVTVVVRMHSPDELRTLYQSAKVNVLCSWFETTGLTQLEAALCGAEIVSTDRGFAADYFGSLAWYCDPSSPKSIRGAVEKAFEAPHSDTLRELVLKEYTWERTAEATLDAYRAALGE